MISPELQQGIINIIYFTWLHNAPALAYFLAILVVLFLLVKKPTRVLIILLLGFVALLIEFEYTKHMVDELEKQTVQAVLEQGATAVRFQKILSLLLEKLIPLGLYLFGWGSILGSIIYLNMKVEKKETKETHE